MGMRLTIFLSIFLFISVKGSLGGYSYRLVLVLIHRLPGEQCGMAHGL